MSSRASANSKGRLFVLSAPSGAGKTSITNQLRAMNAIQISISHTTRAPRSSEQHGQAYFFVSVEEFLSMRDAKQFLEWAVVYGNYYGTSSQWVEEQLAAGKNVMLEIDCQGAMQIRASYPSAVMIFICPPTIENLRERLFSRQQDSVDTLNRRLAQAEDEMARQNEFDYVIINDKLDVAVQEVVAVIRD